MVIYWQAVAIGSVYTLLMWAIFGPGSGLGALLGSVIGLLGSGLWIAWRRKRDGARGPDAGAP